MNLYKISQDENDGYDTYDSAVVAAPNEEVAKNMDPYDGGQVNWTSLESRKYGTWALTQNAVKVEYIGQAKDGTPQGVVCASFNAG